MTLAQAVLLAIGVAAVMVSSVGSLVAREPYRRLHLLAPASTVGAPAVLIAAMLNTSPPGRPTVKLVAILVILVLTAPAVTMAIGRVRALQQGRLRKGGPE